jgi:ADP-heptose:LPS heptosyltransferase
MIAHDKTILSHHGALGDFLCAWPAMLGLAEAKPPGALFFDGPASRLRWLSRLGYAPAPPDILRGLRRLHIQANWPHELQDAQVFRFCLDAAPDMPGIEAHRRDGRLVILPSVSGESFEAPRELHRRVLAGLGLPFPGDAPESFRRLFASGHGKDGPVLLFPGAGHMCKCWPLVQFFGLAEKMADMGLSPLFVLGPAEVERGVKTGDFSWTAPESLERLEEVLLQSSLVVGNDCGPLHLAGMLGIPGVAIFGPTSRRQWGPPGISALAAPIPCRPCSRTTRNLHCPRPKCLERVSVERVLAQVHQAPGPKISEPKK